jgi:hypothetical protein
MDPFRYFHLCNHKFLITENDNVTQELIITNNGTFIDILSSNIRVTAILEVTALQYPPATPADEAVVYDAGYTLDSTGFYDVDDSSIVDYSTFVDSNGLPIPLPVAFYGTYLHNRIRWNVVPPQVYKVKLKTVRTDTSTKEVLRLECPRCQGNAWFIDILDQYGVMSIATGIDKVAQRFIKDLITQLGANALDRGYGTVLHKQITNYASNLSDEKMADDIRLIISGVEDNYLSRQALEIKLLSASEILVRATCELVERSASTPSTITVRIAITTRLETRTLLVPL